MNRVRQIHLYLGTLCAPLLVFLAFSGLLQVVQLHETPKGSSYVPPSWIVKLSQLHRNQRLDSTSGAKRSVPLQGFFVLAATGLITTSLLGIYMAFKYSRKHTLVYISLAIGIFLPALLLYVGI